MLKLGVNFVFYTHAYICEVKMSKSFLVFKRKVRAQSIIAAILLGLGISAAVLAVITLIGRYSGNTPTTLHYVLTGAAAIILSVALYFIFMPSDKRLARRLDTLYSLDEKVSTMVELRNVDSAFAALQREDADTRLGEKPRRAVKSRQLIAGLLVFAISVCFTVGAWLIPVKADDGETPIDEFDKQWLITAIGELITMVENSYVNEGLRESTLNALNSLLDFAMESDYLSEMKAEAITTVLSINSALKTANSAEALSVKLAESSNEKIIALAKELASLSGSASKNALIELGEYVDGVSSDDAVFVADELNSYLASSGIRNDDALYAIFKSLVSAIKDFEDIEDAFDSAAKKLSSEIIVQNVNKSTINIVINKLCNLFGITENDLKAEDPDVDIDIRDPDDQGQTPPDDGVEEPDTNIGSGGLGTGDVVYGSDDMIFDPDTNTYRPFGEMLNDYFAKANEKITDGKTSDEISDAAEEYFGTLFGTNNKDNQ